MASDIKKMVEARVAEEQQAMDGSVEEAEITTRFVMECLESNELGDGMLYAAIHKGSFIYVKNLEEWYCWKGHYWEPDDMNLAVSAVENVAVRYAKEIEKLGADLGEAMAVDSEAAKSRAASIQATMTRLRKRINRLRGDTGRRNCLKFAHTNPTNQLAVHSRSFDLNPWQLACKNGVINLKTGELEPGRREDFITKHSPVEWQGIDANADPWIQAIDSMFEDKENPETTKELHEYLARLYGYGITGFVMEEVFPVHYGAGRNGKSVIVEQLFNVLGDYAGPVPSEMLLASGRGPSNATQPEILELKGLRIAVASETDQGRRFSAAQVKWLTGKDELTARGLYEKKLTKFKPTHLLMMLTNNRPGAPGTDFAFWDRCFLIKHKLRFVKRKPVAANERPANKMLDLELAKCQPGILAWLVRGSLEWQKRGLDPPDSVIVDTDDYQDEENSIERFIESACEIGDGFRISASELYQAFKAWVLVNVNSKERYVMSQKEFGQRLMSLERFNRKKSRGIYHYIGLCLNADMVQRLMAGGDD